MADDVRDRSRVALHIINVVFKRFRWHERYFSFQVGVKNVNTSCFLGQVPQIETACAINSSCPESFERWLLFKYIGGEFTPLSKPLKKKEEAEKARLKYPERERKTIGIGVIRSKS